MERQTSENFGNPASGNHGKFVSVTQHLKSKEFKWLKDDMGLFDLPEDWELDSGNDNEIYSGRDNDDIT